jgi:hypothetical protein
VGKGGRSADSAQTRFRHALQLKTVEDGYNSGRTYYLQAASEDQCRAMCESIAQLACLARERQAARSRFGRFQNAVLVTYESTPFQSAVAVLILAVRRGRVTHGASWPEMQWWTREGRVGRRTVSKRRNSREMCFLTVQPPVAETAMRGGWAFERAFQGLLYVLLRFIWCAKQSRCMIMQLLVFENRCPFIPHIQQKHRKDRERAAVMELNLLIQVTITASGIFKPFKDNNQISAQKKFFLGYHFNSVSSCSSMLESLCFYLCVLIQNYGINLFFILNSSKVK